MGQGGVVDWPDRPTSPHRSNVVLAWVPTRRVALPAWQTRCRTSDVDETVPDARQRFGNEEVLQSMTLSLRAESYTGPERLERDLVTFAYLRELRRERQLVLRHVPALGASTRLYSVWDQPAPTHDHAPRQSDGWPLVVCKEGSD